MEYIDEDFNNHKVYLRESLEEGYLTIEEYQTGIKEIDNEAEQYYNSFAEE